MRTRLGHLFAKLSEIYKRDGLLFMLTFLSRFARQKLPILLRQALSFRNVRAVRREIEIQRSTAPYGQLYCAVAITGGIGDFIVIARFLRDLVAACGNMSFDIFSPAPERAAWIFTSVPGFKRAYHDILFDGLMADYDLAMRANQMIVAYQDDADWHALREAPRLAKVVDRLARVRSKIAVFVEHHPFLDNFMGRTAVFEGYSRRDYLHHLAGITFNNDLLPIQFEAGTVEKLGLRPRGYITVHNGFDVGFVISGQRATKCYPHFGEVVAILKKALPSVVFVQVGAKETSVPLDECDLDLLGRTSLKQVAEVLSQASFHIDNESGLVHLARCYGVTSGVVFGPTSSDYFGYPGNCNIDPPMCGGCWWMTRTWMDACAKGYEQPRCLSEHKPGDVAARLLPAIAASGTALSYEPTGPAAPTDGIAKVS